MSNDTLPVVAIGIMVAILLASWLWISRKLVEHRDQEEAKEKKWLEDHRLVSWRHYNRHEDLELTFANGSVVRDCCGWVEYPIGVEIGSRTKLDRRLDQLKMQIMWGLHSELKKGGTWAPSA